MISLGPGNRAIRLSVDAFIEGNAHELARLQEILSCSAYISKHQTATTSREEDAILGAVDDLVGRLQRSLSPGALRQAVKLSG